LAETLPGLRQSDTFAEKLPAFMETKGMSQSSNSTLTRV